MPDLGMRVHLGLAGLNPDLAGRPIVTIGVFDGVHLGHQAVIGEGLRWARAEGAPLWVLTFDRHPREVIQGSAPPIITSLPHRLGLLEILGVDTAVVLPFTREMASIPAEEFVRDVVLGTLGARGVVLGFNSHFGEGGRGDLALMRDLGGRWGFPVRTAEPLHVAGEVVSSTALRRAIAEGDLARAAAMLGRPVEVLGTVIRGDGRGAKIGFPTANLDLHHEVRPPRGVYAGRASWRGGRARPCVLNIGRRPTFGGEGVRDLVEVHVMDDEVRVYGVDLLIQFVARLREERTFRGVEALVAQIRKDCDEARRILRPAPTSVQ